MTQLSMDERQLVGETMAICQENKQNIEILKQGLTQQVEFSTQLYGEFDQLALKMEKLKQLVVASEMQLAKIQDSVNFDVHAFQSLEMQVFATGQWNETLQQVEEKIAGMESYVQALEAAELGDIELRARRQLESNEKVLKELRLRLYSGE